MNNNPIVLSILFFPTKKYATEFADRIDKFALEVLNEPGCLCFNVHRVVGVEDERFTYEVWRSEQEFDLHRKTLESCQLNQDLGRLLSEPPKSMKLDLTSPIPKSWQIG